MFSAQVSAVVQSLEENLELLCVTGVEDQLQVTFVTSGMAAVDDLLMAVYFCPL